MRGDDHLVAVRHPCAHHRRQAGQQNAGIGHTHRGTAVLAHSGVSDRATENLSHGLEAVADAQHGRAAVDQCPVESRGARLVHRRGTTGEDDRLGPPGQNLGRRGRVRHDLGVDLGLTYATGDELRVLGSEVDHQHQVVVSLAHLAPSPPPKSRSDDSMASPSGIGFTWPKRSGWPVHVASTGCQCRWVLAARSGPTLCRSSSSPAVRRSSLR